MPHFQCGRFHIIVFIMVKLRLTRRGRKDYPVYNLVVADARAPRDGRIIGKKLGVYNPNVSPAEVTIAYEQVLDWVRKGAQPTETVQSLLSASGLVLVRHLLEGIQKGAITSPIAKKKFTDWHKANQAKKKKKVSQVITIEMAEKIFQATTPITQTATKKKKVAKPSKKSKPKITTKAIQKATAKVARKVPSTKKAGAKSPKKEPTKS